MDRFIEKNKKHLKRKKSIRKSVHGTTKRPRVAVYRTNKHIYAQIIDDEALKTLVSASDLKLDKGKMKPVELAMVVGEELGKKAKDNKIKTVVFDRAGYKFHGRVKAIAEGLRKAGLEF